MRLIDADAFAIFLKDAIKRQEYEDTKIDGLLTVADVIEAVISELDGTSLDGFKNAPTIEPQRKTGKWLRPEGDSRFMCSVCKCKGKVPTIMCDPVVWDYCPNSGCKTTS